MKRSAFLIPCHPPKFHLLGPLLRSYHEFFDDNDLFVVFTTEAERDQFRVQFPDLDPRYFIHGAGCTKDNVITTKKFKGLNDVFALGYEYAGVIDAECLFLKRLDYDTYFREWFAGRRFYGSEQTSAHYEIKQRLLEAPKRFFNDEQRTRIDNANPNNLYCWFNNVPIYERKSFEPLLERISYDELLPEDFDYTIYMYHLIAEHGFTMETIKIDGHPIKTNFGFLEDQPRLYGMHLISIEQYATVMRWMRPLWVVLPNDLFNPEVMLRFHLDRTLHLDCISATSDTSGLLSSFNSSTPPTQLNDLALPSIVNDLSEGRVR
jgi:hypothetical protein